MLRRPAHGAHVSPEVAGQTCPESSDGGSCAQDIVVGDLHTHHDNATLGEMPFFLGLGVHKPVRPSCSVRCAVSLTRTPVVSTCHGRCPAASLICTRLRRRSRLPLTLTSRPTCHRSPGTNAPVRPRHHPPVSFRVCSNVVAETLSPCRGGVSLLVHQRSAGQPHRGPARTARLLRCDIIRRPPRRPRARHS